MAVVATTQGARAGVSCEARHWMEPWALKRINKHNTTHPFHLMLGPTKLSIPSGGRAQAKRSKPQGRSREDIHIPGRGRGAAVGSKDKVWVSRGFSRFGKKSGSRSTEKRAQRKQDNQFLRSERAWLDTRKSFPIQQG